MSDITLADLQASVKDCAAFGQLSDYASLSRSYLTLLHSLGPTRIVSPSYPDYIFYQYGQSYGHRITRPLNTRLFIESEVVLAKAFERFGSFLERLRRRQDKAADSKAAQSYLASNEFNRVIYTLQQSLGCVSDSFENSNQSRKRIGQLFESMVKLILQQIGLECEPRTITLPIPGYSGQRISYQLDLVFSRGKAILASETRTLSAAEVVGSVKTTSKDRIDKVFLDKFLLTRLLGRAVPVVAIFLHDVQRSRRGNSIFSVNSTFKSNHFLAYTVALNRLDGVYYVDPRPEMTSNPRLREHIHDFQRFLVSDI